MLLLNCHFCHPELPIYLTQVLAEVRDLKRRRATYKGGAKRGGTPMERHRDMIKGIMEEYVAGMGGQQSVEEMVAVVSKL